MYTPPDLIVLIILIFHVSIHPVSSVHFFYNAIKFWNKLPVSTRSLPNVLLFKKWNYGAIRSNGYCQGRGGDAAWFDGDCRRAFELKQSAYHRWCRNRSAENWDLFCQARGTANRLYAAAKARYSADCRRNLDDCASANAWWRTLKSHVFGAESDIPPLCSPGGALVSDPAGKAELLST